MPGKNESHPSSDRFTDWLPAEPDKPPFCQWVIFNNSALEETTYPCGGDAWPWHGMVEPLADIEREPSPFEVIQYRPAQTFADPLRRLAGLVLVLEIILRKALKLRSEDA
jgi:hypothetical protein